MFDFVANLFDTSGFPPRWRCGVWTSEHGWLHILSDLGVWSAYVAIPLVLGFFAIKKRDLPFRKIFWLFGAFILACGSTHLMEAAIFWWPAYRLAGAIKLFTALVSWGTVIALIPIAPRAFAMRSPEDLEREVAARTAELARANELLQAEIHERKRAEEDLVRQREQLRITLSSIGDGVIVTDARGCVTLINPVAESLVGWSQEQAQGVALEQVFSLVNEQTRTPVANPATQALARGQVVSLAHQTLLIARDGTERPIDDSAAPIRDPDGSMLGAVLVFRDVTESQRIEQAVRESEARKSAILETAIDCIITFDDQGRIIEFNPAAERTFRYRREEIVGQSIHQLIPPMDSPALPTGTAGSAHGGNSSGSALGLLLDQRTEVTGIRSSGTPFPLEFAMTRISSSGPAMYTAYVRDISERIQAESAIRTSEERLRLALEAGRMGTWEWDIRTNKVVWSATLEKLHGLTPGTFPGTFEAVLRDIHPDDKEMVRKRIGESFERGKDHCVEYRLIWPDGTLHWAEGRGRLFCDHEEKPVRMAGVCMDITERKQAEQAAQFLMNASQALAALIDHPSTLQKVAQLAVPLFADWCLIDLVQNDNTLGRLAIVHHDQRQVERAEGLAGGFPAKPDASCFAARALLTGQPELVSEITEDLLAAAAHDAEHLESLRAFGLKSYIAVPLLSLGEVLGVITFISAESGRRYSPAELTLAEDLANRAVIAIDNSRLYRELREADRRKDEFLAMLAHELRNPLAPIRNSLALLGLPDLDAETLSEVRGIMERQVEHVIRLVDDLLDVSRIMRGKIELRKESVELAAVVHRAVETARPLVESQQHRLSVSLPSQPIWLEVDPIRVTQVIGNLLNNAAKYTDRGGRIQVLAEQDGEGVVIRVRDNGIGIPASILPRVFDLFTQADRSIERSQGGLGIGLTLVRSLVEMHGGTVKAASDGPGQGSEFSIYLPCLASQTEQPSVSLPLKPARRLRILVVEDNIGAAKTLGAVLTKVWGHEVEMVHDGLTALEAARHFRPHMMLVDIGLPGISGYEVAKRLSDEPDFKHTLLVALTGYGQEEDRRRSQAAGFDEHLVKPASVPLLQDLFLHQKLELSV